MVVEIKEHMFVWYDTDKSTAVSVSSCGIYKSISRTMWYDIQYYTIWYTILAAMLCSTRSVPEAVPEAWYNKQKHHCILCINNSILHRDISAYAVA